MTRGVLAWGGAVIAAGSAIWLVGYFVVAGFHPADTLAVIGAVVGITGVVLAVAGLVTGRRGGQSVTGSGVGGGLAQVRGGKNVRIHRRGRYFGAGAPAAPVPDGQPVPPPAEGGQSVTGSQIAGPVDQVDGASGDVELREEP
ncbi:hypothetical protein [Actinomadura napierensis]|uniref:Uncharacterized protein n=1 Tax=Actinomadura napierensis TaxID=267854 RepID=A0ABN3AFY6_9ACTN